MKSTTKVSMMKKASNVWPVFFFVVAVVIGAMLYNQPEYEDYASCTNQAKTACITTHQTLNKNESQEFCGVIVSYQ